MVTTHYIHRLPQVILVDCNVKVLLSSSGTSTLSLTEVENVDMDSEVSPH